MNDKDKIMIKKYSSKVSYGLLVFIFLVFYGPIIPKIIEDGFNKEMIGVISFLSLVFAFILHLFLEPVTRLTMIS